MKAKRSRQIYQETYYQRNKERIRAKEKERIKANPDHWRNRNLIRNYGISLDNFNHLLESQENSCAICGTQSPPTGKWHVDHCHTHKHVRGILCQSCNSMLGFAKDNTATLSKGIEYLTRNSIDQNKC